MEIRKHCVIVVVGATLIGTAYKSCAIGRARLFVFNFKQVCMLLPRHRSV